MSRNTRYISVAGNNANACTLAAPCRTLQYAINIAPAGGEIQILDSGFFGNNATIKKSLTISGNGPTVYLGSPIAIDDADAVVALRGLTLNGQGAIADGIRIAAAAGAHIERCLIHGFTQDGIQATAPGVELFVTDSTARNNGANGLVIFAAGASRLTIDNSHFDNNGAIGVSIQARRAAISRSTASGNAFGISASFSSISVISTMAGQNVSGGFVANNSAMTLESSVASGNNIGLSVTNGGTAWISTSTFTKNTIGIATNGNTVRTRQNNTIIDQVNGSLTAFSGM